jgi:Sulfotransferase family
MSSSSSFEEQTKQRRQRQQRERQRGRQQSGSASGSDGGDGGGGRRSLGQQIVQRAYDEAWSDFVSICTSERIQQYKDMTTTSGAGGKLGQRQQPPEWMIKQLHQPISPVLGSPQMIGLRHCLQYIMQLGESVADVGEDAVTRTKIQNWPWWMKTMIRDMEYPRGGLFGLWHQLQFHHPRSLQLCVYEKGGTKKFRNAHCRNINNDEVPTQPRQMSNCYLKQRQFDPNDVTDRVVFLRDPLDRFLSGFLDKCVRRGDAVDHCEPTTVFYNTSTSPVHHLLWDKKFFFDMYVDTLGLKFNMHFFPQALQCGGLYHSLDSYSFVGSMGTDFYRDLTTLTKLYPEIQDDFEGTFKLSQRGSLDNDGGVETGAANQVLEYYTPRTVRRVLQYYAIDYVTLNLTIPQWAEDMLQQDEEADEAQ